MCGLSADEYFTVKPSFFRYCSVFLRRRKEGIVESAGRRRRPNPCRASGRRLHHNSRLWKNSSGWNYMIINWETASLWESHLKTLWKTLFIVWQNIFEWSTNCTSIKDCFWFLRRTLEPSRIFWLSARLKHLIVEEGYQNNASGWLLKMTWVGRPKSPLPQRNNQRGHPHNTQDDVAEVALSHTGLCVVHWNTGYQQHHHFQ